MGASSESLDILKMLFQYTWFIVFPVAFFILFKEIWMDYVWGKFSSKIQWTLLELIPPGDIERSPQPMESVYFAMAGVIKSFTPKEEFIQGATTFKFSLEIVSSEGMVHMYIRTPVIFRDLVESHIYAQYPDAQVMEVPDYVNDVPPIVPNKEWDLWGTDLELVGEEALPIKTYKFFEEDVTGTMIDPFAGLIEVMGKLPSDQKLWFQMVIEPLKETWAGDGGRKLLEKLTGRDQPVPEGGEQPLEFRLTPGEKKIIEALESNIGKNMFQTKLRLLYLGKREGFSKSVISAFMGGLKQFSDINLNSFKPNDRSKTYANYIFTKSRLDFRQRVIFRRYKNRDDTGKKCVLSTEELATLFHFPDMSVKSPFIQRVGAKRGGAPSNLPID